MIRRSSKRFISLWLCEAVLVALAQQIGGMTGARGSVASKSPLIVLFPLEIIEGNFGSKVMITAEQPFKRYYVTYIGTSVELRIRNADGSRVQRSFQGPGFDGQMLQRRTDVILSFHLQRGVTIKIVPGANGLGVDFFKGAPSVRVLPMTTQKSIRDVAVIQPSLVLDNASPKSSFVSITDIEPPPTPLQIAEGPSATPVSGSNLNVAIAVSNASQPATANPDAPTKTEEPGPFKPRKPAPAQIILPPVQWPRARSRAPLSQEKRFELSGVLSLDYSSNKQITTSATTIGSVITNRGHNFGVGLDLHLGTFLIDPRFMKFSLETGFTTNRGAFDEFSTRQGNKGARFDMDFLPTSPYPFRFHFTRQNTHFLEQQVSSASTARRSLGFDWSVRKPKLPNFSVNFEDASYDSRFIASSSFKSQSRTLSLSLADQLIGWDVNSHFSRQSATEGITNLKTNLDFLRFDGRRQLSSKVSLFVGSFFEKLHFENPQTHLAEDFSFFDVNTDFSLQQTKELSFRASHQFYYSSNDQTVIPTDKLTGSSASNSAITPKSVTSFNAAQGQVNYRLHPALLVSSTVSARFINTPERTAEVATRFLDFAATISWNKRLGFAETRANFSAGATQVRSNLGASRVVLFNNYSAGISMGRVSRAQLTADFNGMSRPDPFQIGGYFKQRSSNVAVETHGLGRLQLRAGAGRNVLDYLNASGREHLEATTYFVSVDSKWFTVLLNRNSNDGTRHIFLFPISPNGGIFRVLPIDALLRDPLLNGSGVFTIGLVRLKPRKGLEVEARYLKDDVLFARTNNVFSKQFDILARYKLGQITLTGGLIRFQQDTEGLFQRDRNYFFFRLSRPFTIY
jgi:hypothetical protein